MLCPIDGSTLLLSERQGIEIDYCPQCRGVWLDRGELDKIIERAAFAPDQRDPDDDRYEYRESRGHERRDDDRYRSSEHGTYSPPHRKKRRGFLGELFDID